MTNQNKRMDTNSVAENWMKTVKGSRRLRPAQFIVKLNDAKKGRLKESELIEKGDRENDGIDKNDHKRTLREHMLFFIN